MTSAKKNDFQPVQILRNYMKLVIQYCVENDLLEEDAKESGELNLPFSLGHIPLDFPQPKSLIERHIIGNNKNSIC